MVSAVSKAKGTASALQQTQSPSCGLQVSGRGPLGGSTRDATVVRPAREHRDRRDSSTADNRQRTSFTQRNLLAKPCVLTFAGVLGEVTAEQPPLNPLAAMAWAERHNGDISILPPKAVDAVIPMTFAAAACVGAKQNAPAVNACNAQPGRVV